MSIVQYRIYEVVCDNCGATWTGSTDESLEDFLEITKQEGWEQRALGYLGNKMMAADLCQDCSTVTDQKLRQKRLREKNRGNNKVRN